MNRRSQHVRGILQTFLGVLILTPDALIIRLIQADTATLIFWRGFFQFVAIAAYFAIRYRGHAVETVRSIGRVGVVIACFYVASNIFFINSIRLTAVANTLVIVAASPLVAALFTWIFLHEHVPLRTWLAAAAGFAGIAIIFAGSFGDGSWTGDLMAAGAACTLGATFVIIRSARAVSMVPAVGLTGLLVALVTAPFAETLAVSGTDLAWLVLLGGVITTISFGLITLGPRYLPAPEVNLIMLLETVLGPVWVWFFLHEAPPGATWIGGLILVGALVVHSVLSLRAAYGAGT